MKSEGPSRAARFFMGGLGGADTEADLREAFLEVGVQLESIEVIMNPATGCSRGFALGVLRWPSSGPQLMSEDQVFAQLRTALVHGHAVTVQTVPGLATHRTR
jgi:hypothetical protein